MTIPPAVPVLSSRLRFAGRHEVSLSVKSQCGETFETTLRNTLEQEPVKRRIKALPEKMTILFTNDYWTPKFHLPNIIFGSPWAQEQHITQNTQVFIRFYDAWERMIHEKQVPLEIGAPPPRLQQALKGLASLLPGTTPDKPLQQKIQEALEKALAAAEAFTRELAAEGVQLEETPELQERLALREDIERLEQRMDLAVAQQDFEQAADLRDQIREKRDRLLGFKESLAN